MALYDAVASRYDAVYSTPHIRAENRVLSSILRRWRFFSLPIARAFDAIPPIIPTTAQHQPDQRYNPEPILVPYRQFLDIGCGTGLTVELSRLAEQTLPPHRYLGIDPSRPMLDRAREKFPDYAFIVGTAEFADAWGQFERVVSLFGPFNYADPLLSFPALARVTQPGGRVALVVYTEAHYRDPAYILHDRQNELPIHTYSATTLRECLHSAGFIDIHIYGMSPPKFYALRGTQLLLARAARQYLRTIHPDEGCFLIAKARRSWDSA